jgi:hypothetical protein
MWAILARMERWLDRVDPGTHRRVKGLRLVTAYGIAEALGALRDVTADVPSNLSLGTLAGASPCGPACPKAAARVTCPLAI